MNSGENTTSNEIQLLSSTMTMTGIFIPSIIGFASLLGLVIIIVIVYLVFLFHKRRPFWKECCCGANVSSRTLSDTERLTTSVAYDDGISTGPSDESGFARNTTGVSSSISNIFSSLSPSSSSLMPSSSSCNCSFASIDENAATNRRRGKAVTTISRGVQTDPVLMTLATELDDENNECPFINKETPIGNEEELLANRQSETEQVNPPSSSSVVHFDDFSTFVDYVKQQPAKICPVQTEPILRPILENLLVSSSSTSVVLSEITNAAYLSTAPDATRTSLPSSSTKRKWEDVDESDKTDIKIEVCKVQELVPPTRTESKFSTVASLKNRKTQFTSTITEKNLHLQKLNLAARIDNEHVNDIPALEHVDNTIKIIQILREVLLGRDNKIRKEASVKLSSFLLACRRWLTSYEFEQCINFLQELQQFSMVRVDMLIFLAQNLVLYTEIQTVVELIIGVDATPSHFGGYCINLKTKKMEFYVMKVKDIPWKIVQKYHSDEFEMKNCAFALSVWSEQIDKHKRFSVYTDNNAVVVKNKFGRVVESLLQHFCKCRGAHLCSTSVYVNRKKDLVSFAKFIQPADDLSRNELGKCIEFLCNLYGIKRKDVGGTHYLDKKRFNEVTPFYKKTINSARDFIQSLESSKCEHSVQSSSSFWSDLHSTENVSSSSTSLISLAQSSSTSSSNAKGNKNNRYKRKKMWKRGPKCMVADDSTTFHNNN